MARFVNSTAQTAADQPHVLYAILVQLDFASGFVRAFNGVGTLQFNGNTYLGLGQYGSIGAVGESTKFRPSNPVVLTLSGLPDGVTPLLAAAAINRADYFGRSCRIDIALFDSNRKILTPIENAVWEGRMDAITVSRGVNSSSISLSCEDRMVIWDKNVGYLYTTEYQSQLYAGDTFFSQVPFLANQQITWGGTSPSAGVTGGGGRPPGPGGPRPALP
jgi:hypothetical protein